MTTLGVVGLNHWGPNLVRNFDQLANVTWLCDLDPTKLDSQAGRYSGAKATAKIGRAHV